MNHPQLHAPAVRPDSKDIAAVLHGWDYEAGTINVRKVVGANGLPKLQMRLNLGLLQMEMTGRPDGTRPHGVASLLDYFTAELKSHHRRNGTYLGFHLTSAQCQQLREEAMMYYHRYLGLFVIEDFAAVVRDTAHNLKVMDLCAKYALEEVDRAILEQYRPYVIMMNVRATAILAFNARKYADALKIVQSGMRRIRSLMAGGGNGYLASTNEMKVLQQFAQEIRRKLPVDPVKKLQSQLNRAIRDERYEDAARLRDLIAAEASATSAARP